MGTVVVSSTRLTRNSIQAGHVLESDLLSEDFVEGGVELFSSEDVDGTDATESTSPRPTRSFPVSLYNKQVEKVSVGGTRQAKVTSRRSEVSSHQTDHGGMGTPSATTPTRQTRSSAQTSPAVEVDLPSAEFVEGGVELSPSEGGVEGAEATESMSPRPTRALPASIYDRQLEEFWPDGTGQRALFLDYDGTLREFENRPELATPTAELEKLLAAINGRQDLVPHIISGRDAKFLGKCFGTLDRTTLIAEHGFQICRPGSEGWELTDHPDGLDRDHDDWKAIVRNEMIVFVDRMPGSHIEEKSSALVWHYREVVDQEKARCVAAEAMVRLEGLAREKISKVRISHGHKVVEVSYRKVRKGPVMRRICEEKGIFGNPFLSVLVAGDDVSDESMFDIAPNDFLTIKVGSAATLAKFRVETPAQLRRFLWQLVR
jgi:trehalose-phosphatase